MTEFVGLDHIQLGMAQGRELDARDFYAGVLGMIELEPPPPLRGLWFRAGTAELHLDAEEGYRACVRVHPAFRVRGLRALAARCIAAGYAPRHDTRYPGRRRFYVVDPFGNELELLQLEGEDAL